MGKKRRTSTTSEKLTIATSESLKFHPSRAELQSSKGRIPELIPIRYGRMVQSPFTFYRGTALNMAADLATTPGSGLRVQVWGDCHLSNFGAFATPNVMREYGEICGWILARSHARSGSPAAISGYIGKGDAFVEAVADFSVAYADQTEQDHETLVKAVRSGKLEVFVEEP